MPLDSLLWIARMEIVKLEKIDTYIIGFANSGETTKGIHFSASD